MPPELDGFESTLDLPAFDISEQVNPSWLIAHLTRPSYYENQVHLARGQRKARRIAPEDFLASPIYLPSRGMQDKVADLLAVAEQEITLNRKLLEVRTRQERGLIQKLITGEWRTKVDNDKEAAA